MDPTLTAEIAKQGLGYILFLLALGAVVFLYRRVNLLQERIEALQEKRIEETKSAVLAMERNTTASTGIATSQEALTGAMNDLTKGFAAVVAGQEGLKELLRDRRQG